MKRKLFQNYSFEFDKNEKKLLTNFCKQIIKQMESDDRFQRDVLAFNSVKEKLDSGNEVIKFTKDEKTRLILQLKNNRDNLETKIKKSNIFVRWLFKSMYNQYNNILLTHFSN
jgi:hypothetical protein